MEIFTLGFMQRAIVVAICISIITPLIGNTIVLKRLSAIGDALSHAGLAGVAIGLCFGFNPVFTAILFSVISALIIEFIRTRFTNYSEIATAIVLSFAVGIAAVFSGFISNSASFNSFLFGSIVAISEQELIVVVVLAVIMLLTIVFLRRELFYIAFDEEGAELSGVKVKRINTLFTIITAVVVAIASRTVGALVISSLMVIPVACAMLVSGSYKQNIILSVIFALFFTIAGLIITSFYDLKPGGTIVLIGIATLIILLPFRRDD
ncbi:MAG TPA: metal ABC transporter permease [Lachnospiraceae bacterium]|nr:metal ABC transporter permease [Lachnospiraceae bacterium]